MSYNNKAWKVTEANQHILSSISGYALDVFFTNIGWVLVEDWNTPWNRFYLIPQSEFEVRYPGMEFEQLKVDEGE